MSKNPYKEPDGVIAMPSQAKKKSSNMESIHSRSVSFLWVIEVTIFWYYD